MSLRNKILTHAVKLSAAKGYASISRTQVARSAKVAPASVSYNFGSMRGLQEAVLREAIARAQYRVILQAITARDPLCKEIPPHLRQHALALA